MNESYLKQYVRQQREKRQESRQSASVRQQDAMAVADSGQQTAATHKGSLFAQADVQRGLDAQKTVQATRESSSAITQAIAKQSEHIAGSIRIMGTQLTASMDKHNSRLIRAIEKAAASSGGGRGLFDLGNGGNGNQGGKPSKWGTALKVAGGALAGGVLGHYAGAAGAKALGFSDETADTAGMVGTAAGSVLGGVLLTEGGRKGVLRAGQAIVQNPGKTGAVMAGGYAAYQGAKNLSTLVDSDADATDRIRAGSHVALSGVGAFVGHKLGGAQGAAYGAAAGDFAADAAEYVGRVFNDAISGTKIGDVFQTAVGTTMDTVLAPFSEDARSRLGQTFDAAINSTKSVATDVAGSVTALGRSAGTMYDAAVTRTSSLVADAGSAVTSAVGAGSKVFSDGLSGASAGFGAMLTSTLVPSIQSASDTISSSVVNFQNWYANFSTVFDKLTTDLGQNFDRFTDGASLIARSTWAGLTAGATRVQQEAAKGFNAAAPESKPGDSATQRAINAAKGVAGAVVAGAGSLPSAAAEVKRVAAPGVVEGSTKVKGAVAGSVGSIAEFFESSGRGVNTVSTGKGDHGGVSYGKHQLASKNGSMAKFLESGEAAQFSSQFAGLTPGTKEFNDAYTRLATGSDSEAFAKAQKQYIDRTHFEPVRNNVTKSTGIDIANRSKALNEAVYSTSVQYGAGMAPGVLKKAFEAAGPGADDATLIAKLQDYKQANVDSHFRSSSANQRAGVAKRTQQEKEMLLKVLETEQTGATSDKVPTGKYAQMRDAAIKQAAGAVPSSTKNPADVVAGTAAPAQTQRREKTPQELNPELFKQSQTTPLSPVRVAETGTPGQVRLSETAKSYSLSPLSRSRDASGAPSMLDTLAKSRPTEFERIREKPTLTQQVEISNLPEPQEQNASAGQQPVMIPGKGAPYLDEIPLVISDMGLVLLQMGHT